MYRQKKTKKTPNFILKQNLIECALFLQTIFIIHRHSSSSGFYLIEVFKVN